MEGTEGKGFDWGERWDGGVCVQLVLLADGTALDVFSNVGSETGPPEVTGDQLASFKVTGVSGGFVIMTLLEDGATEGIIVGNIYSVFVGKDTGFVLPVREAGTEGARN